MLALLSAVLKVTLLRCALESPRVMLNFSRPLKTSRPSDPPPKIVHIVSQHKEQMLRNYGTAAIAPRTHKTKWFWEKSAILQHIVPRSRPKLNTTEDCTLYPLFFMTQTHLEVCTESSNTERIMLSLAAIAWATVSPVAISSGCFSISPSTPLWKKLATSQTFLLVSCCISDLPML